MNKSKNYIQNRFKELGVEMVKIQDQTSINIPKDDYRELLKKGLTKEQIQEMWREDECFRKNYREFLEEGLTKEQIQQMYCRAAYLPNNYMDLLEKGLTKEQIREMYRKAACLPKNLDALVSPPKKINVVLHTIFKGLEEGSIKFSDGFSL